MTIEVRSLTKKYDVSGGKETAVDDIDFTVGGEEFFTLVGPSGCGKSTTLRCIAGLETPTSGRILVDGEDITDTAPNNRGLAMMFQDIALYPHMSVLENIAYPLKVRGIAPEERHQRARDVAELMQIPELLDKYPGELSGGQRQRTAIARTVVYDPSAFLMDEPLSDLDAKLKVEIRKEIQRVHERAQKPTIYVTHDQGEALSMSDRIAVMNDGNIMAIGTPDDLYETPKNMFVAGFIGNPSMNFLPGTVSDGGEGTVRLDGLDTEVAFGVLDGPLDVASVEVGVRPEKVDVSPDPDHGLFSGTLELLERIGDRRLATISASDREIRALNLQADALTEGEDVSVVFDPGEIHLFNSTSGEAIAHPETRSGTNGAPTPN